jgi:hypothetical protein
MLLKMVSISPPSQYIAGPKALDRSGAKYCSLVISAPANVSVLNDVFTWFIVPFVAVGCF